MTAYPHSDSGFYHLTGKGWIRQAGIAPLPEGCVETWRFESEQPAEDAKERVCLTRVWARPDASAQIIETLHLRFGSPLKPTPDRNITLECDV